MTRPTKKPDSPTQAKLDQLAALRARIVAASKPDAADMPEAQCADLVTSHPNLHLAMFAHLIDGGPDEGCTITLWGKDNGLGGILNVKYAGCKAFIDAGSLQEWLSEAERMLSDPEAKWQRERNRKRSRAYGRHKH